MAGEMVERIGEVILKAVIHPKGTPGGTGTADGCFDVAEAAKLVIAAMREPTEAMQIAGAMEIEHEPSTDDGLMTFRIWEAMIDAALREGGE